MKKKIIALLMVVFMTEAAITGCGSSKDYGNSNNISTGDATDKTVSEGGKDEAVKSNDNVTVEEQVLLDQNGVKVTLTGMDTKGFFGPELKFTVENSGSKNISVYARDTSVNGVMTDTAFMVDVAAGKKANQEMNIFSYDLKNAGIETIQNVETKFAIVDPETFSDIYESDVVTINTSAAGTFEQTYNTSGTEVYNSNSIRIVAQKLDSKESFWGADIYFYVENNSDKRIMVSAQDVSINGVMIDPIFADEIVAGKKAFSSMTFLESDLTDNGIDKIESLDVSFHIYDSVSYNDIDTTSPITLNFK